MTLISNPQTVVFHDLTAHQHLLSLYPNTMTLRSRSQILSLSQLLLWLSTIGHIVPSERCFVIAGQNTTYAQFTVQVYVMLRENHIIDVDIEALQMYWFRKHTYVVDINISQCFNFDINHLYICIQQLIWQQNNCSLGRALIKQIEFAGLAAT